ncbi:hypothetical protein D3C72_864500 [compost metagenome]
MRCNGLRIILAHEQSYSSEDCRFKEYGKSNWNTDLEQLLPFGEGDLVPLSQHLILRECLAFTDNDDCQYKDAPIGESGSDTGADTPKPREAHFPEYQQIIHENINWQGQQRNRHRDTGLSNGINERTQYGVTEQRNYAGPNSN